MRKKMSVVAAVAVAIGGAMLLLPGAGAAGGGSTTIEVGDDFFSPDSKKVSSGTKVKFKWTGQNDHNVTKTSGPGSGFASDTTDAPGVNFQKTFKKKGTYKLVCTIHAGMDMSLKVK